MGEKRKQDLGKMDKPSNIEIKGRQGEIRPQEDEYPIHHKNIGNKIMGYKGKQDLGKTDTNTNPDMGRQ
jgi:hypothetical protein